MRFFIPKRYIGGEFFGKMINKNNKSVLGIKLNIKQNLISTFANGYIFDKNNNNIIESFEGYIVKEKIHEDFNSYFFIFITDDNEKRMMKVNVEIVEKDNLKQKFLIGTYWNLTDNTKYQVDINRKLLNILGKQLK
jgi:hypothetical protein